MGRKEDGCNLRQRKAMGGPPVEAGIARRVRPAASKPQHLTTETSRELHTISSTSSERSELERVRVVEESFHLELRHNDPRRSSLPETNVP